jgi:glycosyltransferase involved in cell wall biosynthesis
MKKSVGVVLPVRDGAELLPGCLRSLEDQHQLADSLVVVDDGSRDESARIARDTGAAVLATDRLGPYAARNLGCDHLTTELVLFLDVRCRPRPDWIRRTAAAFENESVGFVSSNVAVAPGRQLAVRAASVLDPFKMHGYLHNEFGRPYFPTCNLAVRRADVLQVGGFPPVRSGADAELCWRLLDIGRLPYLIDETLMEWVPRSSTKSLLQQYYRYGKSNHLLRRERGLSTPPAPALARLVLRAVAIVVRGGGRRDSRELNLAFDRLALTMAALAGVSLELGYRQARRQGSYAKDRR